MKETHSIKGVFYSNVLILGKEGEYLSTVSDRKANWYLKKDLANEVEPPAPYPRAIRLKFNHAAVKPPDKWDLHIGIDYCVLCGTPHMLSLHHIVPRVIRRTYPVEYKNHSREWCVLLCLDCHRKVEDETQPIYQKNIPSFKVHRGETNSTLQFVKHNGTINKIPPDRLQRLFDLSDYKTIDEIPPYRGIATKRQNWKRRSEAHQKEIQQWAETFIQEHGGIEGTNQYFLDLFLKFNPKYLPSWFEELIK